MSKKPKSAEKKTEHEVYVLNGPNLNMLGQMEPEIYGEDTLEILQSKVTEAARALDPEIVVKFFQTNAESEMLEYIHGLALGMRDNKHLAGIIFNLGGWAHTSIALRDAVLMLKPVPMVEVMIANPAEQEEFRQFSVLEDIIDYRVIGMGQGGYIEALQWLLTEMKRDRLDIH